MSRAQGLSPGIRMKRACETRLRDLVPREETIVAVGTAEQLRELGPNIGSGGGWTFVVVTVERLLFAPWGSPGKPHESILLDAVTRWTHGSQYNCHVIVLEHPPMTRKEWVAAHRVLWFKWGDVAAQVTRALTIFRFSRRETEAAKTIRAAMNERNVPDELLQFKERSREERTRGSQVVLKRR